MTTDEQSGLIRALKQHDPSAWSAVIDRHLQEVYGFVFHLLGGDRMAAEDLNQETWLEALEGIDQCDPARGSFRNWLFGIARRRVALHYRQRNLAEKGRLLRDPPAEPGEGEGVSVLPEDVLEQAERRSVVRAAILVLPEVPRAALLGKYVEGLSVEAIATRMGRTPKAVESLLSRARYQLRGLLGKYMVPCGGRRPSSKESARE